MVFDDYLMVFDDYLIGLGLVVFNGDGFLMFI